MFKYMSRKTIKITAENKNRYAYARVSTDKQLLDRQLDMLEKYDIPTDHYFTDVMTGTKIDRPGFDELMKRLEPGDELYVESFSRLSRSTKDLLDIIEKLNDREVSIHSLHEKFDTTTASGKLMLTMVAALSQFEHDLIVERTREGLRSARARGHNGGRPKMKDEKLDIAFKLYDEGSLPVSEICKRLEIGESTFYKYNAIRKMEEKGKNEKNGKIEKSDKRKS